MSSSGTMAAIAGFAFPLKELPMKLVKILTTATMIGTGVLALAAPATSAPLMSQPGLSTAVPSQTEAVQWRRHGYGPRYGYRRGGGGGGGRGRRPAAGGPPPGGGAGGDTPTPAPPKRQEHPPPPPPP